MRRFASVFLPKREKQESKKSAAPPPLGVSILSNPTAPPPPATLPPTPQLTSQASDRAQSSSSSTASASIQTPDDDSPLSRSLTKKSWKSWLGTIKSGSLKRAHLNLSRTSVNELHVGDLKLEREPRPPVPPILLPPPPGNRRPVHAASPASRPKPVQQHDSMLESDDEGVESIPLAAFTSSPPSDLTHACSNVKALTERGLVSPSYLPPFASTTGGQLFPRSCNSLTGSMARRTLMMTMFRTRLLRRLEEGNLPVDAPDILAFSSYHPDTSSPQFTSDFGLVDIPAITPDVHVLGFSPGIRRWISRPCFEDRFVVWFSEDSRFVRKPVAGTSFAVLELEYSEALEAMAGFGLGSPTVPDSSAPSESPLKPEAHVKFVPYAAAPSPLRQEHPIVSDPHSITLPADQERALVDADTESSDPSSSQSSEDDTQPIASQMPEVLLPAVKRGVRFADDVSNRIPAGYALRVKKRREEKAKFLREEQSRRALEAERRKIAEQRQLLEQEKRQREKERIELEREKQAWEREKRDKQERRERALKEEVANARMRREAARAGKAPSALRDSTFTGLDDGLGPSGNFSRGHGTLFGASSSSSSLREGSGERNNGSGEKKSSRLSHDPSSQPLPRPPSFSSSARQPSSTPPANTLSPTTAYGPAGVRSSNSNSGSSPGSSRPPSLSGNGTLSGGSYSSHIQSIPSIEDFATNQPSDSKAKRHSIASTSSRPGVDRSATMPTYPTLYGGSVQAGWNGSHPNLNGMAPMNLANPAMAQMNTMMFPGMPGAGVAPFMMDMPLLPPTPPFMMQQYPRRPSTNSTSSSRDRSGERRGSRQRESSQGSRRSSGSEANQHLISNSTPPSPYHAPSHSRRGSADMSPSSFSLSKRTSSGLSLNHGAYRPGPSSSSSSLAQHSTTSYRHSQGPSINHERAYSERGRSMHPTHPTKASNPSLPSPWTALPTQNGTLPNQMPTASSQRQQHSQPNQQQQWTIKPSSTRRQTAFS